MLSFQKLDVYQRSMDFLILALEIIRRLPKGHSDLADQLKRAAESVPHNISEGAGRFSRADKTKFYVIARGSAMECAGNLDIMRAYEVVDVERYERAIGLLERVVSMLTRMIDPK